MSPEKAAAEAADQPAAGDKAKDQPVQTEQQAPTRIGGEGAPAVAGRENQEKPH
jgi:hypothetical protein